MSNLSMRKKNSPIVWGVMGLLVLGLGGFGVTNFSGGARAIGPVDVLCDTHLSVNFQAGR